jgi:hypothetical protein
MKQTVVMLMLLGIGPLVMQAAGHTRGTASSPRFTNRTTANAAAVNGAGGPMCFPGEPCGVVLGK